MITYILNYFKNLFAPPKQDFDVIGHAVPAPSETVAPVQPVTVKKAKKPRAKKSKI